MKRTFILSLLTLLTASTSLLTLANSRDRAASTEPELASELRAAFDDAVEGQVLVHINPPIRYHQRLSRAAVPQVMNPFRGHVLAKSGDHVLFEIVHTEFGTAKKAPTTKTVATGRFEIKSGDIELWDDKAKAYVPAAIHSLVLKKKAA